MKKTVGKEIIVGRGINGMGKSVVTACEAARALRSIPSEKRSQASRDNGRKGGRPSNEYFIVPAPGYYGDRARVVSSHRSLKAAIKAAGNGEIVRRGDLTKGQTWLRVYENLYPVAE